MKWSQWYYYSLQSQSIYSSSLWFQLLIFCVSSSSPARFSGSFEIPRSNADPRRRRPGSHRKHRRWISALPARGECGGRPRWEVRAPPPTLDGTPDRHPERGDCNSVRAADLFVFSGPSGRLRLRGATWFPGLLLLSPLPRFHPRCSESLNSVCFFFTEVLEVAQRLAVGFAFWSQRLPEIGPTVLTCSLPAVKTHLAKSLTIGMCVKLRYFHLSERRAAKLTSLFSECTKKSNPIVIFGVGWFQFLYLNEFFCCCWIFQPFMR